MQIKVWDGILGWDGMGSDGDTIMFSQDSIHHTSSAMGVVAYPAIWWYATKKTSSTNISIYSALHLQICKVIILVRTNPATTPLFEIGCLHSFAITRDKTIKS